MLSCFFCFIIFMHFCRAFQGPFILVKKFYCNEGQLVFAFGYYENYEKCSVLIGVKRSKHIPCWPQLGYLMLTVADPNENYI